VVKPFWLAVLFLALWAGRYLVCFVKMSGFACSCVSPLFTAPLRGMSLCPGPGKALYNQQVGFLD